MTVDVVSMLERMAEYGTAPDDGCNLFGVGYEDAFSRLRHVYFVRRFQRGGSAHKFVVGPFGSGKTHFLRQLMEIAREEECVTAEVTLNKDVDFERNLHMYREVVRELRVPGQPGRGVRALLAGAAARVAAQAPGLTGEKLLQGWIRALSEYDFSLEAFGRVCRLALEADAAGDESQYIAACRWLGGEMEEKEVCRTLGVAPISRADENLRGRLALLSLFQFVRQARLNGTVVAFDEAEQGLSVEKAKLNRILSMLQSAMNALADLNQGSALIVYAVTPDLLEAMERFPALQQRVASPGPGMDFFDGNTLAPTIGLARRRDAQADLEAIGRRLVDMLFTYEGNGLAADRSEVDRVVRAIAIDVADSDPSTSNRRTMVKRTCAVLVRLYYDGELANAPPRSTVVPEDEV